MPPPTSPPSSPKPQPAIVETLNARFRDGHPDSDLANVGLILRQFDLTEDQGRPWRGCPGHVVMEGAGEECHIYGQRFSASIVNAKLFRTSKKIPLFSTVSAGVVYNPKITLNCVYGGDGGTRKLPEDGCGTQFCDPERSRVDGWCDGMPHRTSSVGDMLGHLSGGAGYNEVVINTKSIDELLPAAVDAIFYVKGSKASARRAREVHEDFLKRYKLDAARHPLLRMDQKNMERPFIADEPGMT